MSCILGLIPNFSIVLQNLSFFLKNIFSNLISYRLLIFLERISGFTMQSSAYPSRNQNFRKLMVLLLACLFGLIILISEFLLNLIFSALHFLRLLFKHKRWQFINCESREVCFLSMYVCVIYYLSVFRSSTVRLSELLAVSVELRWGRKKEKERKR